MRMRAVFIGAVRERATVVAVGLALQSLPVVRMHLRAISNHQVAVGEAGKRIELIEEDLTEPLALLRIL